MPLTQEEIEQRVRRGCALLDKHEPGWRKKVNLDHFNMESAFRDILGSVFYTWGRGLDVLELDIDQAVATGFSLLPTHWEHYPELTEAWKRALSASR